MTVADISIRVDDRTFPGYLAEPQGPAGQRPGVVVIHEIFGINDDIRHKADEMAAHGYLAVAPDLYQGKSWPGCVRQAITQVRSGSGPAFEVLDATRAMLAERPDCTGKVGVIGFCLGGGFALLCAPRPGFAAAAVNYGDVPKDAEGALAGSCPIVGSFGARDQMGTKPPERLQRALVVLDVKHDVKVYPNSGHRFMSKASGAGAVFAKILRLSYNEDDAADAWRRIYAFFDAELGGTQEVSEAGETDPGQADS
jgi:carboxymethylenebutenolidase